MAPEGPDADHLADHLEEVQPPVEATENVHDVVEVVVPAAFDQDDAAGWGGTSTLWWAPAPAPAVEPSVVEPLGGVGEDVRERSAETGLAGAMAGMAGMALMGVASGRGERRRPHGTEHEPGSSGYFLDRGDDMDDALCGGEVDGWDGRADEEEDEDEKDESAAEGDENDEPEWTSAELLTVEGDTWGRGRHDDGGVLG